MIIYIIIYTELFLCIPWQHNWEQRQVCLGQLSQTGSVTQALNNSIRSNKISLFHSKTDSIALFYDPTTGFDGFIEKVGIKLDRGVCNLNRLFTYLMTWLIQGVDVRTTCFGIVKYPFQNNLWMWRRVVEEWIVMYTPE